MKDLVNNLTIEKLTISTAESFTGGEFAARVVKISGASKVFKGALVAYQDEIKINLLNVSESIIKNHGAVSKECAEAMAQGVCKMLGFKINQNFSFPFMSCTISDFFRRFNIGLAEFTRKYIYITLGGNRNGFLSLILAVAFDLLAS